MTFMETVNKHVRAHENTDRSVGRINALGMIADFINAKLDETGITTERNLGYRMACRDITAKILELLKAER